MKQLDNQVAGRVTDLADLIAHRVWHWPMQQLWHDIWNPAKGEIWHQIWDHLKDPVRHQAVDRVANQVDDEVRRQVWRQIGLVVDDQRRQQIYTSIANQIGAQMDEATLKFARPSIRDLDLDSLWSKIDAPHAYFSGGIKILLALRQMS